MFNVIFLHNRPTAFQLTGVDPPLIQSYTAPDGNVAYVGVVKPALAVDIGAMIVVCTNDTVISVSFPISSDMDPSLILLPLHNIKFSTPSKYIENNIDIVSLMRPDGVA